jgi:DNA-binding protein WhiA
MPLKDPRMCKPRDYLKILRKQKKISAYAIAEKLGHSRQAYERYENGQKDFSVEKMTKVFEVFSEVCGISHAALFEAETEYQRLMQEIREEHNIPVNRDFKQYHLDETARASKKNIENINIIMKYSSLDELPPQLKEVAELRLAHPDWSYVRMSEVLGIKPDTVGGRFRKISAIAQKLLNEQENTNENN